ncbi:hypothetical protein HY643_02530, partial [Candidatus Woesearchaeota archaeon]|nr:hypothetical protein [Candidatus Woesearchaeota archaeon]
MEYNKTGKDEAQSQQQKVELKKILEATLKKEGSPVELGDVSKWEKIDPMTLLVAKKLNLGLNESYLPLLRDNPETGIYTLIIGKYYQRKAEDDGLKDVAQSIEALLQKEGTNIEQLMVYALHTFKDIPDIKKILGNISEAKKTVKAIQKLEDRISFYAHPIKWFKKKISKNENKTGANPVEEKNSVIKGLISKSREALEKDLKKLYAEVEGKEYQFTTESEDFFQRKIKIGLHSTRKKICEISFILTENNKGYTTRDWYYIRIKRKSNGNIKIKITESYTTEGLFGRDINSIFGYYAKEYNSGKSQDTINNILYTTTGLPNKLRNEIKAIDQKEKEK